MNCSLPAAGRDGFWCSRTRRAWAFRPLTASTYGRPFLRRPATVLVGPDRLNRLCFACDFALLAHDRPIVRPPLLRFVSLQRLQAVLRYPRLPRLRTIPLRRCAWRSRLRRRSDSPGPAPSLRFFRLVSTVRPAHAERFKSRFTPARSGSFATVSLSRGVPLPV